MALAAHDIELEALSLPTDVRTQLILKLMDSIESVSLSRERNTEKAWLKEANRRYEAYLAGDETAIPAEQVFAELRAENN